MAARTPSEDVLAWVKKDNRRFLHADIRVGDLNRTIKYDALSRQSSLYMLLN